MSDAPATPPKLPAWALLTGATLLAVGTRVLIAVAERSAGFGQTKELTAASIAAAALAAAVGTYVGRRWINRPSGFLLGVALAGIAMLLLAGTSHVGVGLGVGLVMSGLVLWLRNPWRMAAAGVVALVAGAVTYFAVPVESAIIWGTLAGVLTFLLYGYRIPPREGRGLKTWIAFAGRTAAIALAAGLALWWGRLAPVRALIAKVQSSQGNVHFVDLPKPLRTFRKQLQTAGFVPVRGLGIYGPAVTTDLVASMGRLGSLEEVWIENAALDPEALTGLAAAPALKRLVLDKCQVSPTAWASLSQSLSLSHVALYHVTLGDEGLAALAHIPNLHWLSLEDAAVTHAGLVAFQNQPGLSTLFVTGPQVNADWLRELRHLPTITELRMSSWDRSPPAAHPTPAISPLRETGNSPELAAVRAEVDVLPLVAGQARHRSSADGALGRHVVDSGARGSEELAPGGRAVAAQRVHAAWEPGAPGHAAAAHSHTGGHREKVVQDHRIGRRHVGERVAPVQAAHRRRDAHRLRDLLTAELGGSHH